MEQISNRAGRFCPPGYGYSSSVFSRISDIEAFLSDWPPGSPAHDSYYRRIIEGPGYHAEIARLGLIAA